MPRLIANLVSTLFALLAGVATFFVSITYVAPPERPIDWLIQLCAGLTVAIIIFFTVWGHFQKLPTDK